VAFIYPKNFRIRTIGEKRLITYLQKELDNSWCIYYEPIINDQKPDLVLFSEQYGLVIIEVKDYKKETIKSVSPNKWEIVTSISTKKVDSPYVQAQDYAYELMDIMSKETKLLQIGDKYQGKLKFPIVIMCVFSNLNNIEINQLKINNVIPEENIYTFEFLEEMNFQIIIHRLFSRYFLINPLSEDESNLVKELIYPRYNFINNVIHDHTKRATGTINDEKDCSTELKPFGNFISDIKLANVKEKINIFEYPTFTEEILFVATEIRHLIKKGTKKKNIFVGFYKKRNIRGVNILEEILSILNEMGVQSSLELERNSIHVNFIDNSNELNFENIFLVDLNSIRTEEEKISVLTSFTKISTHSRVYITFNGKSTFTKDLLAYFNS
jgi:hypothetical protein